MRVIAWLMLVAFALSGFFLLYQGTCSLIVAIRRRPHLRKVLGTVMTVEKTRETRTSSDSTSRMRTYVKFHPVINFTTDEGKIVSFKSEMGESYQVVKRSDGTWQEPVSRYSAGQRLEVFYDPMGEMQPCLASWTGLYGPVTAMIVAGFFFFGGSALMWIAFKDKLLGS